MFFDRRVAAKLSISSARHPYLLSPARDFRRPVRLTRLHATMVAWPPPPPPPHLRQPRVSTRSRAGCATQIVSRRGQRGRAVDGQPVSLGDSAATRAPGCQRRLRHAVGTRTAAAVSATRGILLWQAGRTNSPSRRAHRARRGLAGPTVLGPDAATTRSHTKGARLGPHTRRRGEPLTSSCSRRGTDRAGWIARRMECWPAGPSDPGWRPVRSPLSRAGGAFRAADFSGPFRATHVGTLEYRRSAQVAGLRALAQRQPPVRPRGRTDEKGRSAGDDLSVCRRVARTKAW